MSFDEFVLRKQYGRVQGLGDRFALMKNQIEWDPFIPLVRSVFHDGHPFHAINCVAFPSRGRKRLTAFYTATAIHPRPEGLGFLVKVP